MMTLTCFTLFYMYLGSESLTILSSIGSGAFGQVFKAVWRGMIVAAKIILTAGNDKVVNNELNVYQ